MSARRPGDRVTAGGLARDRLAAGGRAAAWVIGGASLVVVAQLRGLAHAADGDLVWNAPLVLLLLALGLANVAAWRQAQALRRLARPPLPTWQDEG